MRALLNVAVVEKVRFVIEMGLADSPVSGTLV